MCDLIDLILPFCMLSCGMFFGCLCLIIWYLHKRNFTTNIPILLSKIPLCQFTEHENTYETCAVCLEGYETGDRLRILYCGHAYHKECIDHWILQHSKLYCPICKRRVFDKDQLKTTPMESSDSDDSSTSENSSLLVSTSRHSTTNVTEENLSKRTRASTTNIQ